MFGIRTNVGTAMGLLVAMAGVFDVTEGALEFVDLLDL